MGVIMERIYWIEKVGSRGRRWGILVREKIQK